MEWHVLPEDLHFRLRLQRGAAFTLDMAETIPMKGVTAVTGPSGSGKTTLLRTLAGLDRQESDDIRIMFRSELWDEPGQSLPPEARRIGFVFQDPNLFPHMSVEQNLRYGARRRDVSAIDGIVDALDLAPLLTRDIQGLSGGEARRVALGRALAANPSVLFLDEPLSGLDNDRKFEVLPYLARAVAEARVPAIYVTHAVDEVTTLADRVLSIAGGRIVEWGHPPLHLMTRVVGHVGDTATLQIIGAEGDDGHLLAQTRARVGERVRIGLPVDGILVSGTHPGQNSALVTLPGIVRDASGQGGPQVLDVYGQRLRLSPELGSKLKGRVWLSILRAMPRPEASDSSV